MLEVAQYVAVLCCTLFAGAAVYINLVEHPARLGCGTALAATVWGPSYLRATAMQAPLAVVSCLAGIIAWLLGGGIGWLVAAVTIGLVVPVTFIVIMPVNSRLLDPAKEPDSDETLALLVRWGRLHAIRSVLGVIASLIYLALLTARE